MKQTFTSSLVKYCNRVLKAMLLVVLTCNISGAFAATTPIIGNQTYSSSSKIVISSNTDDVTDTTIIKKTSSSSSDGNVTISNYTYNKGTTVEIGKTEKKKGVLIIEGNLTITGKSKLSVLTNSKLIVQGNLTIEDNASLTLNPNSELYVFGNLEQKGTSYWLFVGWTETGDISAKNATIAVGGDYKIHTGALSYDDDNAYIDPSKNPNFYVFGHNDLEDVGISSTPKTPAQFEEATGYSTIGGFLPIELTSFSIFATADGFTFNWVTASEVENDYFTLEYSIDGVNFNEIDYIHGAGTTSETSEYEYRWDEAPDFEMMYFRLKQTDYNGEYSYSDVLVSSRKKSSGANGTFRYGPLNFKVVDGQLQYIVK